MENVTTIRNDEQQTPEMIEVHFNASLRPKILIAILFNDGSITKEGQSFVFIITQTS